jgi:hypothetical protein
MPGVFAAPKALALSAVIDDLALVATASSAEEWFGRVVYLPLR